ncbi:carbohydrate-binding module family 63 protein [Plenodomus tracheiphilus IPT5]|uniref:Carbohydrate-binding module family 63 protein n=1 Tax=Plenodomus tracheiphilus IPT5 TaxID=1408161 RepID=A0A6A7AVJ4_9PLEO|nr:carbohydrate-binding module family 63 protein [Plenodomus tracheiphilus IPT5]
MKYIFALLPLAGLAVAESVCSQQTVTYTETEKVYKTVDAADLGVDANTKSSTCSRRTVTATTTEKVYVTIDAPEASATSLSASATGVETIDVTSTSTLDITTTITVRPSTLPPYSNSTTSALHLSSSSSEVPYPTLSSEAPVPSSTYEAPTAASPSAEATKPATDSTTYGAGSKSGEATFYGGNVSGGMCSFTGYTIPSGIYGTALSDSNWSGAGNCGVCVSVTGPNGNKITAMVVDQCPGCGPNHLDLFPDAFAKLDNPNKGVIPVSWDVVPCGITTPIVLKNKEGTSKYWFSMQVMNSNVPVAKLEVSIDGGASWKATTRKEYNFFENPAGFGKDSVDVKVTSTSGKSIVVKGVSIAAQSTKTAGSNFSS